MCESHFFGQVINVFFTVLISYKAPLLAVSSFHHGFRETSVSLFIVKEVFSHL